MTGHKKLAFVLPILLLFVVDQHLTASSEAKPELEITVRLDAHADAPADSQSKAPKFRVELRNVADHDLILNLGIMLANGHKQYPNAIVLTITDSQGKTRQFDLRGPAAIAGRMDPLVVPLPLGSTFSVPVDLDKYWAAASKEFDYKLERGTYFLLAQFAGRAVSQQEANLDVKGIALMPYWTGSVTSNRLQFEVGK